MPSSGAWRLIGLVRTDVSEKHIASIFRGEGIGKLLTTLTVTGVLMMETILSFETSVLTGATRRHIPEESMRRSHSREDLVNGFFAVKFARK
jgi:hypothetical protein